MKLIWNVYKIYLGNKFKSNGMKELCYNIKYISKIKKIDIYGI